MTRPEEIHSCYSLSKQLVSSGHTQKSIHNSKNISHLEHSHAERMLERSPRLWEKKSAYYSLLVLIPIKRWSEVQIGKEIHTRGHKELPFYFRYCIGDKHLQINFNCNYIYPEINLKGQKNFLKGYLWKTVCFKAPCNQSWFWSKAKPVALILT